MKIYVMTDLEGVAGVMDAADWLNAEGRYYETAKALLTEEVNAAVGGFLDAGFDDVVVADGHGHGGIHPERLHPEARLMRGWPTKWPLLLDETYDAVAWVGQHAKAGTEYSHLTHTQWWNYVDLRINGVSIGELGQFAMCASELGVPGIFASGEKALAAEARELMPWIETVCVKEGTAPGRGDELDVDAYAGFHPSAIHLSPAKARETIGSAAQPVRTAQANHIAAARPGYRFHIQS